MSMAIVCMVNNTALRELIGKPSDYQIDNSKNLNQTVQCVFDKTNTNLTYKHVEKDGPFIWNKSSQGFLLSAYFYGFLMTTVN